MITQYQHMFKKPAPQSVTTSSHSFDAELRARPGQRAEHRLWYASAPDLAAYIAYYAVNAWVYTAVSRLAEAAASAPLNVVYRDEATQRDDDHPLARLLGEYGEPNPYQTTIEFWEEHYTQLELSGNAFWSLESAYGGMPTAIHILPAECVRIVPGKTRHVAKYEYVVQGDRYDLEPATVVHFKRANPYSKYWGLSAFQALGISIAGDVAATEWNRDFFGAGVAVPSGILVVPTSVSDDERDRIAREWEAKHGQRRKTAIVRADPGAVTWYQAGLDKREYDFENGRKLTRQEVYEALGLPLGYLSEASTEAHARVAERQYMHSVYMRHQRTANRITTKLMMYFPGWRNRKAMFRDVRLDALDWKEQAVKIKAIQPFVSVNEIRTQHLGMEARDGYDELSASAAGAEGEGAGRSLSDGGQVRDVVDEGQQVSS